ncbi:carbohydrate ABC transporter permease [Paenibacillaceae bacterium WGS1546]|uniref:carbohydrate ABC transporter permease n=1 Tax=Cohnella sp. WGS1546 TaxID=3366810 RepID=UPI00372D350E
MVTRTTMTGRLFTSLKILFLLFIIVIMLFPFVNMIAVSLSGNVPIMQNRVGLWPVEFNLKAYESVLSDPMILRAYLNTFNYVTTGTLISLAVSTMGAFALSRSKMVFKKTFMMMIVFTMFFNGGMIPTFLVVRELGLMNTMWAVILPGCVSAWNLILMRTFFLAIPKELEEAGTVDGLSDTGILFHIFLPLSKAALATFTLFYAVGYWNSFFAPFLYLQDPMKYPLQVLLRSLLIANEYRMDSMVEVGEGMIMPESIKFATIVVSTLPIVAIYPFVQRYFVKGVMIGSVKG